MIAYGLYSPVPVLYIFKSLGQGLEFFPGGFVQPGERGLFESFAQFFPACRAARKRGAKGEQKENKGTG